MTSPHQVDRLITDLNGRWRRLLALAGPVAGPVAGPGADLLAGLSEELTELGEQLLVADEELRVQQEEIDRSRLRLAALARERDHLWSTSAVALAVTDLHGVVRNANRAADVLMRRPAVRVTPRPIAGWFAVSDRTAVRSAIGEARRGAPVRGLRVTAVRADGTGVPVEVDVEPGPPGRPIQLLRWQLVEVPDAGVALRSVPHPDHRDEVGDVDVVRRLADFAGLLLRQETPAEVIGAIIAAAHRFVDGVDAAGVSSNRRGRPSTQPGSDPLVVAFDTAQRETGEGPLAEAVNTQTTVLLTDVALESRWPRLAAAAAGLGVGSVLVVPLPTAHAPSSALTVVSRDVDGFDDAAVDVARALAVHAGAGYQHMLSAANLRAAVENRQVIGEAVGVLVERHRITQDEAFARLVRASQDHNIKLREVARGVVETGQEPDDIRPR